MPAIAELVARKKVKFKPKRYRAWEIHPFTTNAKDSTTDSTTNAKDSTTDSTTNAKDSTTDSTTNAKDSTTDSTTNAKDSTTDSTTNAKDSTTDSTTNAKDSTTDSTTNAKDSTTDSTTNAKDSTTDSTTNAKDSTTDSTTNAKDSTTDSTTNAKDSTTDSTTNAKDSTTDSTTNAKDSTTDSTTFYVSPLSQKLIIYFLNNLENKKKLITAKISISSLSSLLEEKVKTVRQSLLRLKNKKCIKTIDYSTSSISGYSQYEIDKNFLNKFKKTYIYNSNNNYITNITIAEDELKNKNKNNNLSESKFKLDQNNFKNTNNNYLKEKNTDFPNLTSHQSENTTPSSADPRPDNKKLTYSELPEEWQNINYHLIEDLHFKPHHLITLYQLNALDPETIDESIKHFAYGIKHNPDNYKKYADPLKVFYGSLRKGNPWIESSYKSTKEIATEELIKTKIKAKRKVADQQCELIDTLEQESFYKWYQNLSNDEKKEIRDDHSTKHNNIYSYYDEKIFKLHYSKEVMAEYQDPKEKALAEYLEKKKEQRQNEIKRIAEMLQSTGATKDYFLWLDKQTNKELAKITERKNFTHETMTQEEGDILKVYFAKNILIKKRELGT